MLLPGKERSLQEVLRKEELVDVFRAQGRYLAYEGIDREIKAFAEEVKRNGGEKERGFSV